MLKKIKIFSLILFFLLFASLSLYFRALDYLQGIVLIYSFYAIFLFLIPVFSKRKIITPKNNYFPFVSILIPARNEINVISSTIHSLASIDYHKNNNPNFEIIVVDDSSIDGTNLVLQSLKKQLSNLEVIIRTPENGGKGKASALNEGLKYCKGGIIAVFDADTRVSSDYLKNIVPSLANEKIGGAQGKIRIYNSRKNFITKFQEDEFCLINHLIQIARSWREMGKLLKKGLFLK
ncbi:MAG: glycosyltransferase family 2 protein [Armatimonadetes bacterium]|nr:glycosyltransferase family 2 protein [Armatimonadota bacterium]